MGKVSFQSDEIPVAGDCTEVIEESMCVDDEKSQRAKTYFQHNYHLATLLLVRPQVVNPPLLYLIINVN